VVVPPATPPVRRGRRQFSLARFGILLSSVVLGVSPWLPWATIQVSLNGGPSSSIHGDLFKIMSHGWRNSVVDILIGLAAVCALQALVFPFPRIALASAIIGFLSLVPVILGVTQVHTYVGPGFSHPPVSIGYGVFVAFGGCLLLIMAWAVFPTGLRRPPKRAGGPGLAGTGPVRSGPVMEGLTPFTPPVPPARPMTVPPLDAVGASGPAVQTPDAVKFSGLPTLGAAMAQLAERDRQGVEAVAPPVLVDEQDEPPASSSLVPPDASPAEPHRPDPSPASLEATDAAPAEPEVADLEVAEPEVTGPAEPEAPDSYPPGWYADYDDTSFLRYWDGAEWTEHTHPATADH
jgi:hypothetical protein